jgi:diguanylate cyclase (GGDEF)-like protein
LAEDNIYTTIESTNRKDEINKLINGFNQMIDTIRNRNKNIKEKSDRIHFLAFHDDLTGLPNYNQFKVDVNEFIEMNGSKACMMQIDVNDLKVINSIMGYNIGNRIIISAAEALEKTFQDNSIIARTSGNEFSILTVEDHRKKFDEFKMHFDERLKTREIYQDIDFHRAVVKYPQDGTDHRELFSKVNVAMRVAKDRQQSFIQFEPSMQKDVNERVIMVEEIKKALRNNEFQAVYQAKVNKQGTVVGVEGLTRWTSEKLGVVRPDVFIQHINQSNLANQFGNYTLASMLGDYEALTQKYGQSIHLSINISPIFFLSTNFISTVKALVEKFEIPDNKLILEITEDVFIKDFEKVREIINALQRINIEVSLDDFGTGYSSLSYIQKINANELKIDKSFVNEILDDEKKYVLFNSICEIGKAYDYKIVAEGVETLAQLEKIKDTPINYIQGYYYSTPEKL